VGFGEHGKARQQLTYGKQLENGAEFLLSASHYDSDGRDIRFPRLNGYITDSGSAFTNQPLHVLQENNERLFFKGSYEGWTAEFAHIRHTNWASSFLDFFELPALSGQSPSIDDNGFVSLKYDTDLSEHLKSSTHLYYGQYLYREKYQYLGDKYDLNSSGRWRGADFKFVGMWSDRHKLLFGGEYRDDYEQKLTDTGYAFTDPARSFIMNMRTTSVYAQDEYRLTNKMTLTPGVRYDENNIAGGSLSPRMAAIYEPWKSSTFKLSYGKAFRNANPWEIYPDKGTRYAPETVTTTELVWQQQLPANTHFIASVYKNHVDHAIWKNYTALDTTGQEMEIEHIAQSGFRVKASLAHQNTIDDQGNWLINSPHLLTKLNLVQPLFQRNLNVGFEVQSTGRRLARDNTIVNAQTIANVTLSSNRLIKNTDVSLNVRNLFNSHLEDVLRSQTLRTLPLESRNIWLQLEYNFK
jgi:iron complex outermembrane receptor protein